MKLKTACHRMHVLVIASITAMALLLTAAVLSCSGCKSSSSPISSPTSPPPPTGGGGPAGGGSTITVVAVGHTTSTNYPVTAGAVQSALKGTTQNGALSVLSLGGNSTALTYSTYLGGSTQIRDIFIDANGNIYFGGVTSDTALPTTPGVFQPAFGGGRDDAFIAKISSQGVLLWLSYLGGNGTSFEEKVYAIAGLDSSGNLTVCGRTPSANFPVTNGAFQTTFIGNPWDGFVAKIKPDGSAIVAATFVGGNAEDGIRGRCVLDSSGNVYGEGETTSTNFPATPGAFQTVNRSLQSPPRQGFVFKLSSNLANMIWSSYLGGSGSSVGGDATTGGIALDSSGNIYVSGYTNSSDIGATAGALMSSKPSTVGPNCFVAWIKNDGTAILALTYLGGSTSAGTGVFEECEALNLDSSGNVLVQGVSPYTNFPATVGVYQPTFKGGDFDGFVSKIAPNLKTLIASTYIGGSGTETGDSSARIEFDAAGNIWTAMTTDSTDFPVTIDAYQSTYRGGTHDEVIFGLTPDLKTLLYGTYVGGNGDDFNRSFRLKR